MSSETDERIVEMIQELRAMNADQTAHLMYRDMLARGDHYLVADRAGWTTFAICALQLLLQDDGGSPSASEVTQLMPNRPPIELIRDDNLADQDHYRELVNRPKPRLSDRLFLAGFLGVSILVIGLAFVGAFYLISLLVQ